MKKTLAHRITVLGLVIIAGCFCAGGLAAQDLVKRIELEDGDGLPDYTWSMKLTPSGARLGVTVCGDIFGPNNHRMVVIDTAADTVVNETDKTGNFPEEIEYRVDGSGRIERIFVSNSSDHSLSVFFPDLTLETTVDLTQIGTGLGQYPFGLLMEPQGRYLYVSTQNAGEIICIDTEPGPTYLDIVTYYTVGAFNGRMAIDGDKLLIPGADFANGAILSILDITNPTQVDTVVLEGHGSSWASANDVVAAGGFAYVPVLDYNGSMLLYEVDLGLTPPAVSRTLDLSPGHTLLYEHGICASPDGNTIVVTSLTGPLMFVGRKAGCLITEADLLNYGAGQGSEAVFTPDGKKVYVTDQHDTCIYAFDNVPAHGLWLDGSETASVGGTALFDMAGGEAGLPGALWASLHQGTTIFPSFTLGIGKPIHKIFNGTFDSECALVGITVSIPANPNLSGKTVYFQGLARDTDGEIRPSNVHETAIL